MTGLAIYGAGGFGREVAPIANQTARRGPGPAGEADIVFVSDLKEEVGSCVNGWRVISYEDLIAEDRRVAIAISDPYLRRRIALRCAQDGLLFQSLYADTHILHQNVEINSGAIVCDYTIFTGNAKIGDHFHCNIYSYVAHDCVIGNFVTFAPRVCCNGRVVIEDDVYVGTGVVLKQGKSDRPLRIGRGAIVGMGAVVTKDVAPGTTVVGNPARALPR